MSEKDLPGFIAACILGLVIVAMAVILLMGKGSFLISGYNTMSKQEKEKYDARALCRFMGKILLPIGVFMPLISVAAIYKINWFGHVYGGLVAVLVVFAVVYCNTGERFKK